MNLLNLGKLDGQILVFGGPYSNLAATQAIRAKAESLGIPADYVICTGDLVAYCAEPAETIDLIREWEISVVMGNCEESLGQESDDCGCGFDEGSACSVLSITWYQYASALINSSQRQWMAKLPRSIDFQYSGLDFKVIHAAVDSINQFIFASDSSSDKVKQIKQAGVDVIIGGHSGIPFGQKINDGYWLNAGVIGMPANDGRPEVWYMLLTPSEQGFTTSWHRLSYDFKQSQKSTNTAGMTEYARALENGLWPSMDVLPAYEREQQGMKLELEPLSVFGHSLGSRVAAS